MGNDRAGSRDPRPRLLVGSTAAAGAAFTAVVLFTPFIGFAYRSLPAHIALDSIEAAIALLVGYLALGRFRQSHSLWNALLGVALCLLGITNLAFSVLPLVVLGSRSNLFSLWGSLTIRLVATGLLAYASFHDSRARDSRRAMRGSLVVIFGLPLAVAIVFGIAGDLPETVGARLVPEVSSRPQVQVTPEVLLPQAGLLALYVIATIGYTRRAERTKDPLSAWIGAACALAAMARINYMLFPSIYTQWVYTGDFLRLGFYLLLLIGAAGEIDRYWKRVTELAVLEERRRVARDLHDGLSQELAFIAAQTKRIGKGANDDMSRISAAAERALLEARHAFRALTPDASLSDRLAFESVAGDVEERTKIPIRVEFEIAMRMSPDLRQGLVRIMQEALNNAARHSGADDILVRLDSDGRAMLTIVDNGRGFDPTVPSTGFGLVSMRERAQRLGGELTITSKPGSGTTVEVKIPS